MNIAIVTFTQDLASMNIFSFLKDKFSDTELTFDGYECRKKEEDNTLFLLKTDKESIFYERIDEKIKEQTRIHFDLIIFATKHQAKSGIPSLSCHTPGNWHTAEYGGEDEEVCVCPANLLTRFFRSMKEKVISTKAEYDVILECTHHGPFLKTPCVFIEIGSEERSWNDTNAGKMIAETILEEASDYTFEDENDLPVAVCFGGLHHCPEFNKRIERKQAHIAHVCPKYTLKDVSEEVIRKAIKRTLPRCNLILYDWKGLTDKERLLPIIKKIAEDENITIKKTKEL